MKLPKSSNLPINYLSDVFSKTTNSYKYYWLLAILEKLKNGMTKINIDELVIEMIGEVWYPINYYKLSFGRQDQFENSVKQIQQKFRYLNDIKKPELIKQLCQNIEIFEVNQITSGLSRFVPLRFIRPWFAVELQGMKDHLVNRAIIERAERDFKVESKPCLYRFTDDNCIEISPLWKDYLLQHLTILKGFTYWFLINYLQKLNPNVSNIPSKLFPPEQRQLSKARIFWDTYIMAKSQVKCIYSAHMISKENYSIDHFLPWSFTGHDQFWNLLPTPKKVNSSKSNNLPALKYLNGFVALQHDAFHTVRKNVTGRSKLLEDYSVLFNKTLDEINAMEQAEFETRMQDNIKPQMQIAKNMGFQTNWSFKK